MEWAYLLRYWFERTCLCRANSSTDGSSSSSPTSIAILNTQNYCLTSNLVTSFHFLFWFSSACIPLFYLSVFCCISCYLLFPPPQGIKVQAIFSLTRGFKLFLCMNLLTIGYGIWKVTNAPLNQFDCCSDAVVKVIYNAARCLMTTGLIQFLPCYPSEP